MRVTPASRAETQSALVKERLKEEALLNKERQKYKHAWEEYLIGYKRIPENLSTGLSHQKSRKTQSIATSVLQGMAKKKARYQSIYENQGIPSQESLLREEEIRSQMETEKEPKGANMATQPPGEMVIYLKEIA